MFFIRTCYTYRMSKELDKAMKRLRRRWVRQAKLWQIEWAKQVLRESAQLKVMMETQPEVRYKTR